MKIAFLLLASYSVASAYGQQGDSLPSSSNSQRQFDKNAISKVEALEIRCYTLVPSVSNAINIKSAQLQYPSGNSVRDKLYENIAFNVLHDSCIPVPKVVFGKKEIPFLAHDDLQEKERKARDAVMNRKLTASALNEEEVINSYSDEFLYSLSCEILKNKDRFLLTAKNFPALLPNESKKTQLDVYLPINDILLLIRGLKHRNLDIRVSALTTPLIEDQTINDTAPWIALQAISFAAIEADHQELMPVLWKRLELANKHSDIVKNDSLQSMNLKPEEYIKNTAALNTLYWSRVATRDCFEAIVHLSNDETSIKRIIDWYEKEGGELHPWMERDPVLHKCGFNCKNKNTKF